MLHPHEIEYYLVGMGVLTSAFAIEGYSLYVALHECRSGPTCMHHHHHHHRALLSAAAAAAAATPSEKSSESHSSRHECRE